MKASQSLPRPKNWQDFETLCKKLWGEIWNCPEIMKNGRSGQNQFGIDIYGIPENQNGYFGIQCKGISEYNNRQLTEDEIDIEIGKAKLFEPQLIKMYFATTAEKDSKIETIIRKKNIEQRKNGLFEVHIYFWEDIVELIFENKVTYDFYLNSHTFKRQHSVKVTFGNGNSVLNTRPRFIKKTFISTKQYEEMERTAEKFLPPMIKTQLIWQERLLKNHGILDLGGFSTSNYTEINRSFVESRIKVLNDGSEPLEHWKLTIFYPEEIIELSNDNKEIKGNYIIPVAHLINHDTYIDEENNLVKIEPRKKMLVGDDSFLSKPIFIKPEAKSTTITIPWKLVSKNFKEEGVLRMEVDVEFDYKKAKFPDDSPLLLNEQERVIIEDFIERLEDE